MTTGAFIGWLIVFGLPFIIYMLWGAIRDTAEYFLETRPYMKSPEYAAELAAREEKRRRNAVEAHRDANTAEHMLWDQQFESLGGIWFCPDCGYAYRRHRVECQPTNDLSRLIRRVRR